jgi:hypothetical protein
VKGKNEPKGKGRFMGRKLEAGIGRELRERRPAPADDYVSSLADAVRPRPPTRTGRRLAVAFAVSVAGVLALSVTAGTAGPLGAPKSVSGVIKKAVSAPKTATTSEPVAQTAAARSRTRAATVVAKATPRQGTATAVDAVGARPVGTATTAATKLAGKQAAAAPAVVVARSASGAALTLVTESAANDQYAGDEGCSHGFWKNHTDAYPPGVAPGDTLASEGFVGTGTTTFDGAINDGGGGVVALLQQAAAAYLNALTVDYPLTSGQVVSMTNAAIASGDAGTIESLKDMLDAFNNLGAGLCDD